MSNYIVIICFFLFRCTHPLPMEGLGEVCILNKPFVNREPYLVFSGRYCVIQKKSVPLQAVPIGSLCLPYRWNSTKNSKRR